MRSHLKKFGLPLLFLGVLLLTGPLEVRAASGCCQIVEDRATESYTYETLEESTCTARNTNINVIPHDFKVGKIANAKGTGCMDDPGAGVNLPKNTNPLDNPKLAVGIPNLKLQPITCDTEGCSVSWLGDYINALYKYGIGIIGILAAIALMIGGIIWLTAAGNQTRISEAKKIIKNSVFGVIISLSAFTLLYLINPNLTKLKSIKLGSIQRVELEEVQVDAQFVNASLQAGGKHPATGHYCGCFNDTTYAPTTSLNTADKIKSLITSLQPNSPLKDYSQVMLDAANKYGVNPVLVVIKAKRENSLGTANSTAVKAFNLGSIKCKKNTTDGGTTKGCEKKHNGCVTSKDKNKNQYRSYASWKEGIEDYFCFFKNSDLGQAPSLREKITRYCPPCEGGDDTCCHTSDYIDDIVSTIQEYNTASLDKDKVNGNNCNCYDMYQHCKTRGYTYCTGY